MYHPLNDLQSCLIRFSQENQYKLHLQFEWQPQTCDGRYIDLKGATSEQYFIFCGLCVFNWKKANTEATNTSLLGFGWSLLWDLNQKRTFHHLLSVNVLHSNVCSLPSVFRDKTILRTSTLENHTSTKKTPIKAILEAHPKWLYFQGYGRASLVQKPSHNIRKYCFFTWGKMPINILMSMNWTE